MGEITLDTHLAVAGTCQSHRLSIDFQGVPDPELPGSREDPLIRKIRYMDWLVDERAKRRAMARILRQ